MGFVAWVFKKGLALSGFIAFAFLLLNFSTASAKQADSKTLLVWGDSLSAAYGIPVEKGWVSLLEKRLGQGFKIVNGSISGETTQGGLSRLANALATHKPDYVILELGANDGLRGIPPQITKNNLQQMIEQIEQTQAKVVLFGMKIPPNYGIAYADKFETLFKDLANKYELTFIPFFLVSIINDLSNFQADELHPTAEAQAIILDDIFPVIEKTLKLTTENNDAVKAAKNPS